MRILDPIHKYITFSDQEAPLVDSVIFQRLRHIRQLGFAEFAFPGAVHTRFLHSLGVCHLAGRAFDSLRLPDDILSPQKKKLFRQIIRLSALLHDIGHGPLSHISETAMPPLADLSLSAFIKRDEQARNEQATPEQAKPERAKPEQATPEQAKPERAKPEQAKPEQATHESYTIKLILQSEIKNHILAMDIEPAYVAHLIDDRVRLPDDGFFISKGLNFKPLLKQIISSDLDMDRMDYLQRDAFFCGTDYGFCDHEWILNNLRTHIKKDRVFLGIGQKAIYSVESFFIGRRHISLAVYFHHKMVAMDEMLYRYLLSSDCKFRIPSNTEDYLHCTDALLFENLRIDASQNEWARRITEKKPYEKIYETQYSFPERKTRLKKLETVKQKLKAESIPFIHTNSSKHIKKLYLHSAESFPVYIVEESTGEAVPLREKIKMFNQKEHILLMDRLYIPPENKQKFIQKS